MAFEDNLIFEEINEELKHDELMSFLKKHSKTFSWILAGAVIGIILHSAWYSQKKQRLELTTTGLFRELYTSGKKSDATLENLEKNAPSEIVPLISIIRTSRKMLSSNELKKNAEYLLSLSKANGVDIIWKDLALLIYCSYKLESDDAILKKLQMLSEENRPFRYSAMEQTAFIYNKMNKKDEALKIISQIIEAKEAPKTLKQRMEKIRSYMINN